MQDSKDGKKGSKKDIEQRRKQSKRKEEKMGMMKDMASQARRKKREHMEKDTMLGTQAGKGDKHWKWLAEGHGPGLCPSMAAQVHGPVFSTTSPGMAKPQIQHEMMTWSNTNIQAAPRTNETASQTMQMTHRV